jgi:hypothetical protein
MEAEYIDVGYRFICNHVGRSSVEILNVPSEKQVASVDTMANGRDCETLLCEVFSVEMAQHIITEGWLG